MGYWGVMTETGHEAIAATVDAAFVGAHAEAVHAVEVADEAVLLDETTGELHLLNPTAALVWRLLDGASPLGDIAADIADIGGLDRQEITQQLCDLLTTLVADGLVVAAGQAGPPTA